jgi:hypothetical protein
VKTLIANEQGRVRLLAMLLEQRDKNIFTNDYDFKKYQELIFDALNKYFLQCINDRIKVSTLVSDSPYVAGKSSPTGTRIVSCHPPEPELTTAAEYAMRIIERVHARSTLPELLQLALKKDTARNLQSTSGGECHLAVYRLLSILGDEKTLAALKEMRTNKELTAEMQEDIKLAAENLHRKLVAEKRYVEIREEKRLEKRKLAREGKMFFDRNDPDLVDLDKPDPEPVSPDGTRTIIDFADLRDIDKEYIKEPPKKKKN